MPSCIACVLRSASSRLTSPKPVKGPISLGIRLYASVREPVRAAPVAQKDILTALHRTSTILPKIIPPTQTTGWSKLLGVSSDILSGVIIRKPRIAVWGLDEITQSIELVSALMEDPLSSAGRNVEALRHLQRDHPRDALIITHGGPSVSKTTLSINSPWLDTLGAEVVVIPTTHPESIPLLYDADVQVIVASPISPALPCSLDPLLFSPSLLVTLHYPTIDQQIVDFTTSRLAPLSPELCRLLKTKVLYVHPSKALSALELFRQKSSSAKDIQAFQDNFIGSGISTLSHAISAKLNLDENFRQLRYAQLVLTGAVEVCRACMEASSRDVATVRKHIEALRSRIHDAHIVSMKNVLGGPDMAQIAGAIERATREMRVTMDALQWWKLPFKADDLSTTLSCALERVWCRDLEAKLHFQAGRLSSLRAALSTETHATLHQLPPLFHSAVLMNTLHQLSSRPPDLGPSTLTYPLAYRLEQLQQPILKLHRHAQRTILATITIAFGSIGGTYAAWFVGWITSNTAVGLGALGTTIGLRWLVGSWEKGRKRWWADWHRVGEGLGRDLENLLTVVLREKVTAVARRATEELDKAVVERSREIKELETELDNIKDAYWPSFRLQDSLENEQSDSQRNTPNT